MWRRDHLRVLVAELVADCEAFLLGSYAELLRSRGVPVPVWAWTNLLAHGSEPDLRAAASSLGMPGGDRWRTARARLAAELLEVVGPHSPLAELQRCVLAPLELGLAARYVVGHWDLRTWMATVRAALNAYHPTRKF